MTQFDQRSQQVETQYNADQITIEQLPLSLTEKQRKQNRTRMLERVQAIWIEGVLEPSLQGAAQLALELQNKPSAIVTPLWQVLREFDTTGPLSSADASIVQVYDRASGEVLILGEPGAGKTTLLLELTRDLLQRARQNEVLPIPVVFPLSSWATRRQPLTEWLASELHSKYQVPLPLASSWIETNQVLPLLDGLDEVAPPHRAACVEAINSYRREHGLLPTVVCSRQADYLALSTRLLLRTAVVVQPLTAEQMETYLTSGGQRLEALRETLRQDADLRALARTPLMLNVLTVAYQGVPPEPMTTIGSLSMKQEHVFASYVQRMLTRRSTSTRYPLKQTIQWLSRLAGQMKRQGQTVFYLKRMQPDWLSGTRLLRAYEWLAVRVPGVLIGMLVSLALLNVLTGLGFYVSDLGDLVPSLLYLVPSLLLGGLLGGLLSEGSTTQRPATNGGKVRSIPWQPFSQRLLVGILIGLGGGLSVGHSDGLIPGLSAFGAWLSEGLSVGLSLGLCSLLLLFLLVKSNTAQLLSQTLPPVGRTKWQCLINSTALRNGLLGGLLVGLLSVELDAGLSYGLSAGFLSLLLIGKSMTVQLTDRLIWTWRSLGRSLRSSQHVRATLQVAALVGLSYGLSYGLREGLRAGLSGGLREGLSLGLSLGLGEGLSLGLSLGLSYWLLIGLFQGVSSETIADQQRMVPNQGIRRSAFNGLVLGLISAISVVLSFGPREGLSQLLSTGLGVGLRDGLSAGLSKALGDFGFMLSAGLSDWLSRALSSGLSAGLSAGLLAGFLKGGWACQRHYALRTLLWRSGAIPWNYPHFLDFAAERLLLRQVGGGYIFLHRLLLDYFADLETEPDAEETAKSRQERLPSETVPSASVEPTGADERSAVSTLSLAPTPVVSEVARLLPCGHEGRPNARFCDVCGTPVPS